MANAIYPKFKEAALGGLVDLDTDVVKALLVDSGSYTYSATDEFESDIAAAISESAAVTTPTLTNGQFNCDAPVFSADGDGTMAITDMPIRVQLTGTAEFRLSPLPRGS